MDRAKLNLRGSDLVLIAIVLFSLTLRFICLYQVKSTPIFGLFSVDSSFYDKFALQIVQGNLTFKESLYLNPLYPFFLAGIYSIFGHSLMAVGVCQLILDCFSCILLYLIGISIFNNKSVGLLASFIYACYGMSIFYPSLLLDTTVVSFLYLALILVLLQAKDKNKPELWFFSGLFIGLPLLLKQNILLFLPFLALWILYSCKKDKFSKKAKNLILIFTGIFIVLLPFSVRSYVIGQRFLPFPAHGGLNFYRGNNPDATGISVPLSGIPHAPVTQTKASIIKAREETGKKLSSREASRYWFRKGLRFITEHPRQYLLLIFRKFTLFWNNQEVASNINYYFCKKFIPLLNLPLFSFGIIAPFAILGFIFALKQRTAGVYLIILFISAYMVSLLLYYVIDRFRLPCVPLLIILASYAIYQLGLLIKSVKIKQLLLPSALLVVFSAFVNQDIPGINFKEDFSRDYNNLGKVYYNEGKFTEAIAQYQKSLSLDSGDGEVYYNLGNAYLKLLDNKQAETLYRKAIVIDSTYVDAYNSLGNLYKKMGREKEALSAFKKAIEINPGYAGAYNNIGTIYISKGKTDKAREFFEQAVAADPDFAGGYYNLALLYRDMGLEDKAREFFEQAVAADPDFVDKCR